MYVQIASWQTSGKAHHLIYTCIASANVKSQDAAAAIVTLFECKHIETSAYMYMQVLDRDSLSNGLAWSNEFTVEENNRLFHRQRAVSTDEARLDVRALGFWGVWSARAYFDVKVFNPYAKSYWKRSLPSLYFSLVQLKRRAYEQRVCEIEHGSFTPLIFAATGGMGKAADVVYKQLASLCLQNGMNHTAQL